MAANQFLPFAQDGGALVLTQTAYNADAQRLIGHQPGIARPDLANKEARQSSVLASGVAQFMADNQPADVVDTLTPAQIATMLAQAIRNLATPAGFIVYVPGTSALPGTVKCNGALLSRATYARLWTFAQGSGNIAASDAAWAANPGQFSPGDGATTFRLPDLRGEYVRAFDDGRGQDAGRTIGSVQAQQLLAHGHGVTDPTHSHGVTDPGHLHSITHATNSSTSGNGISGNDATGVETWNTNAAFTGVTVNAAATGISVQTSVGGAELRVRSVALLACIFF